MISEYALHHTIRYVLGFTMPRLLRGLMFTGSPKYVKYAYDGLSLTFLPLHLHDRSPHYTPVEMLGLPLKKS